MDIVKQQASPPKGSAELGDSNIEETLQQALELKKKELRWKLMQASQVQNLAKLDEIKAEMDYSKDKMKKIGAMAAKLRAKFIKLAKASKIAESNHKSLESRLSMQEKFVAEEMMQLTRLSLECRDIGSKLYGSSYELVSSSPIDRKKEKHKLAMKIREAKFALGNRMIELETKATIHMAAKKILALARGQSTTDLRAKLSRPKTTRLSSLYDLSDSLLKNMASFRLTQEFADLGYQLTHASYAHNICPRSCICLPDLMSSCTDKSCPYQHKSNYIMSNIEKLTDLLSYMPELTGYYPNPLLDEEENHSGCRLKLKHYAAKLIARNAGQSSELVARNLVKLMRSNRSDQELITMSRKLPKTSHLRVDREEEEKEAEEEEERGAKIETGAGEEDDQNGRPQGEVVSIGDLGGVSEEPKDDVIEVIILD